MAEHSYVAVTNIPEDFHAVDLRAHFSSLVESKSFDCFHFRHRPEKHDSKRAHTLSGKRFCCVVKIHEAKLQQILEYDGKNWIGNDENASHITCSVSRILLDSTAVTSESAVSESQLTKMPELNPPAMMPNGNVGTPTLVFLDMIQQCLLPQTLVKKLNLKFPKTQGKRLYGNVHLDYSTAEKSRDSHSETSSAVSRLSSSQSSGFLTAEINVKTSTAKRTELVTLSKVGSEQSCSAEIENSPSETQLLTLNAKTSCNTAVDKSHTHTHSTFNSEVSRSHHSQTEHSNNVESGSNPDHTQVLKSDCIVDRTSSFDKTSENPTYSLRNTSEQRNISSPTKHYICESSPGTSYNASDYSKIADLSDSPVFKEPASNTTVPMSARERKRREREDRKETQRLMNEGIEERMIAIERKYHNDEDAEEWDRHEASEDDPSNQERNTERLYEQEEETPWEKGGPGVVFYTDAQFWQAREGDFDEKTTDDLDVDFSPYEEGEGGDKDIRDFLKIRQEQRFRSGYDKTDRFSIGIAKRISTSGGEAANCSGQVSANINDKTLNRLQKIGNFEKFSKGIGRRVMERQGWREGHGLGRSGVGIKDALRGEGQRPHNKQGLGYTEPPVPSYITKARSDQTRRKRGSNPVLISTSYDDPSVTDPKVPLLQRAEPTTLKHRQSHLDSFTHS